MGAEGCGRRRAACAALPVSGGLLLLAGALRAPPDAPAAPVVQGEGPPRTPGPPGSPPPPSPPRPPSPPQPPPPPPRGQTAAVRGAAAAAGGGGKRARIRSGAVTARQKHGTPPQRTKASVRVVPHSDAEPEFTLPPPAPPLHFSPEPELPAGGAAVGAVPEHCPAPAAGGAVPSDEEIERPRIEHHPSGTWRWPPGAVAGAARDALQARYQQVIGGPPGKAPKFLELCGRTWLDIERSLGPLGRVSTRFLTVADDHNNGHNSAMLPMALCITENRKCSQRRCFRRWWRHGAAYTLGRGFVGKPRPGGGASDRVGHTIQSLTTGVLNMAPDHDTQHLCTVRRCLENVTFAALSLLSRNLPPALLLCPLGTLHGGVPKRFPVSFMARHGRLLAGARWRYKAAVERYLPVEFPRGLRFLRSPVGEPASNISQRSLGAGTLCEFSEAVAVLRPYVFNLAMENADSPMWVTEKIVNAFLAGSIPVYWGTRDVGRFFNKRAFIDARDFPDEDALGRYVLQVYRNHSLRLQYLREPPCTEQQLRELLWWRHEAGGMRAVLQQALPEVQCS